MHHIDLFRHLLGVVDPAHLTRADRTALIDLIAACLAADRAERQLSSR